MRRNVASRLVTRHTMSCLPGLKTTNAAGIRSDFLLHFLDPPCLKI